MPLTRTTVEVETWRRIRLSVAAYAYEYENSCIMSDSSFDMMSLQIDLRIDTTRPDLDSWWRKSFNPSTGMWIRSHPELSRVAQIFHTYFSQSPKRAEKNRARKNSKSSQLELF